MDDKELIETYKEKIENYTNRLNAVNNLVVTKDFEIEELKAYITKVENYAKQLEATLDSINKLNETDKK